MRQNKDVDNKVYDNDSDTTLLKKKAKEMAEMFEKCDKVGCYTGLDSYTTWIDKQYKSWLVEILKNYGKL